MNIHSLLFVCYPFSCQFDGATTRLQRNWHLPWLRLHQTALFGTPIPDMEDILSILELPSAPCLNFSTNIHVACQVPWAYYLWLHWCHLCISSNTQMEHPAHVLDPFCIRIGHVSKAPQLSKTLYKIVQFRKVCKTVIRGSKLTKAVCDYVTCKTFKKTNARNFTEEVLYLHKHLLRGFILKIVKLKRL